MQVYIDPSREFLKAGLDRILSDLVWAESLTKGAVELGDL